jgi:hypothetical protein
LIDYTMTIGRLTARARSTLVSGGARASIRQPCVARLKLVGRFAGFGRQFGKDHDEPEHRNLLLDGQQF